jgi:hypothetical protein
VHTQFDRAFCIEDAAAFLEDANGAAHRVRLGRLCGVGYIPRRSHVFSDFSIQSQVNLQVIWTALSESAT